MSSLVAVRGKDPWIRRLYLPAYQVQEAARYAMVSVNTVAYWQRHTDGKSGAVSDKGNREALSYLQLVEVAFVAVMRRLGVRLQSIRDARQYLQKRLKAEYPFAVYKFKTDGQNLLMDLAQFESVKGKGKLVVADRGGQLAWEEIIQLRFTEFDYENELAARWHVAGRQSPVLIDPKVAYGAPVVRGTPTWILKGRFQAGETLEDIAEDFSLKTAEVEQGLEFEGVDTKRTPTAQ